MEWWKEFKESLKKMFPDKAAEIDALKEPVQKPDIKTEIEKKEPVKPDTSSNPELAAILKSLEGIALKQTEQDTIIKTLTEASKGQKLKDVDVLIQKAVDGKKIPAKADKLIAQYKKIGNADYEGLVEIIENLPAIAGTPDGTPPAGERKMKSPLEMNGGSEIAAAVDKFAGITTQGDK